MTCLDAACMRSSRCSRIREVSLLVKKSSFSKMEPSGSQIVSDVANVARMASAAFAASYDSFTLATSYHGFDETGSEPLAADVNVLDSLGERRPENLD